MLSQQAQAYCIQNGLNFLDLAGTPLPDLSTTPAGNVRRTPAPFRRESAESHREIEAGALLPNVSGGEVCREVGRRNVIAAIFQRCANAIVALADGGVGQTGGVEVV
jgi:hypothetical protein